VGVQNVGVQNFEPLQEPSHDIPHEPQPKPFPKPQQNRFQKIIPHSIGCIIRGCKIDVTFSTKIL
ncbi:MAG: hypothetical protein ACP5PS_08005, partial [Bacteroidales bacterium]